MRAPHRTSGEAPLRSDLPAPLVVRFLGGIAVERGAAFARALTPPRVAPLLAALVLARDSWTARDHLAFSLWPDDSESAARANLRRHVHLLTRLLEPLLGGTELFEHDATAIRLNPQLDVDSDVSAIERAAAAPEDDARAAELYRGEFLPGYYDEWSIAQRERLESLHVGNLQRLATRYAAQSEFAAAIRTNESILRMQPWREDVLRCLLHAHAANGDRAGAIARYRNFADAISGEFGAQPSPETMAAYHAILREGATRETTNAPAAPAPLPFAGRAAATLEIGRAWERAIRGQGGVVAVCGEPGIGKTRFVEEFAAGIEAEGARILRGRTSHEERRPFEAVTSALRSGGEAIVAAASAQGCDALLAAFFGEASPGIGDGVRVARELARILAAAAARRPLLFVLEDLHWAGPSTRDVVERLGTALKGAAVLVVATMRDDPPAPWYPAHAVTLRLGRLRAEDVGAIAAQLGPGASARSAELFAACEGHPLFLSELLQSAGDREVGSLHSAYAARLARIGPRARRLADLGAVFGAAFDVETLRAALGWPAAEAYAACDELCDAGVAFENLRHDSDFQFAHHTLRESIYQSIPMPRRRRYHAKLARIAATDPASSAAQIAYHFAAAGENEAAGSAEVQAARQALARFAPAEAAAAAFRALSLSTDAGTRCQALLEREAAHARLGRAQDRRADAIAAADCARETGDDALLGKALEVLVACYTELGDRDLEAAAIEELSAHAQAHGDAVARARAAVARARTAANRGDLVQAIDISERAVPLAGDDDRLIAMALRIGAHCHGQLGDRASAETLYERASWHADRAGDPALALRVLLSRTTLAQVFEDVAEELRLAREVIARGERESDSIVSGQGWMHVCDALWYSFDVEGAGDALNRFIDAMHDADLPQHEASGWINRGSLAIHLGDRTAKLEAHAQGRVLAERVGWKSGLALMLVNDAYDAWVHGEFLAAQKLAGDALADFERLGDPRMSAIARRNLAEALLPDDPQRAASEFASAEAALRSRGGAVTAAELDRIGLEIALALDDGEASAARTRALVANDVGMAGSPFPPYWYATAARGLRAAGDARSAAAFDQRARASLSERLAALDPRRRPAFAAIRLHRNLTNPSSDGAA